MGPTLQIGTDLRLRSRGPASKSDWTWEGHSREPVSANKEFIKTKILKDDSYEYKKMFK